MTVIKWEEPRQESPGRRPSLHWQAIAAELRSRPGEWALVYESSSPNRALADRIVKGESAFAPAGAYEAKSASSSRRVYARYVGGPS